MSKPRMMLRQDMPSEQSLARAYEGVCAALIAERDRSKSLSDTLELVREYAPMGLHEHMADKATIGNLREENLDLRAQVIERDKIIKEIRDKIIKEIRTMNDAMRAQLYKTPSAGADE